LYRFFTNVLPSLAKQISGQYPSIAEYKTFSAPRPEHELNRGTHRIHFGGEYPSSVILPFIPYKKQ